MEDSIITQESNISSINTQHSSGLENSGFDSASQNGSESVKSHDSESNLIGGSEDGCDATTASPSPPQTPAMNWSKDKDEFGFKNEKSDANGFYETNLTVPEKDVKDSFTQPYNELLVPVNQSKKGLRSGKLYITKELDGEKGCCRKYFCWAILGLLLITGIVLGILAIAGVFDSLSHSTQPEQLKGEDAIKELDVNSIVFDGTPVVSEPSPMPDIVDQENGKNSDLNGLTDEDSVLRGPEIDLGNESVFETDNSSDNDQLEKTSPKELFPDETLLKEVSEPEPQPQPEPQPEPEPDTVPSNTSVAVPAVDTVALDFEDGQFVVEDQAAVQPESAFEVNIGQILQTPGPHVPDVLDVEFKIENLIFNPEFENSSTPEYQALAFELENELRRILISKSLIEEKAYDFRLGVQQFKSGSVICTFRLGWLLLPGIEAAPAPFTPESVRDLLAMSLIRNNGFLMSYIVSVQSIVVYRVTDVCTEPNFCGSLICGFSHSFISFACHCPPGYILTEDRQFCNPIPEEQPWSPVEAEIPSSGVNKTHTEDTHFEDVFLMPTNSTVNATHVEFLMPTNSSSETVNASYVETEKGFVPIVSLVDEVIKELEKDVKNVDEEIQLVASNQTNVDLGVEQRVPVSLVTEIKNVTDAVQEVVSEPKKEDNEKTVLAILDDLLGNDTTVAEVETVKATKAPAPIVEVLAAGTNITKEVDDEADKFASQNFSTSGDDVATEPSILDDESSKLKNITEVSSEAPPGDSSEFFEYGEVAAEKEKDLVVNQTIVGDDTKTISLKPFDGLTSDSKKEESSEAVIAEKMLDNVSTGAVISATESNLNNISAVKTSELTSTVIPEVSSLPSIVEVTGNPSANESDVEIEYIYDDAIENPDAIKLEPMLEKINATDSVSVATDTSTSTSLNTVPSEERNALQLDSTAFLRRTIENEPSEQLFPVTDKPSIELLSEPCGNWPISLESSVFSSRGVGPVQLPPLVRLFFVEGRKSCTATVIDKDWVLASYSCVKRSDNTTDPKKWVIFAGGPSPRKTRAISSTTQIRTVEEIKVHPGAENNTDSTNMALVKVSKPFTLSDSLRAICVTSHATEARQACTAAGWQQGVGRGDVNFSQYSKFLTSTRVALSSCQIADNSTSDSVICSEIDEDDDICLADDGAPMMCVGRGGFWELGGVFSRSASCSTQKSNLIFSAVSGKSPFQWIKETIRR